VCKRKGTFTTKDYFAAPGPSGQTRDRWDARARGGGEKESPKSLPANAHGFGVRRGGDELYLRGRECARGGLAQSSKDEIWAELR